MTCTKQARTACISWSPFSSSKPTHKNAICSCCCWYPNYLGNCHRLLPFGMLHPIKSSSDIIGIFFILASLLYSLNKRFGNDYFFLTLEGCVKFYSTQSFLSPKFAILTNWKAKSRESKANVCWRLGCKTLHAIEGKPLFNCVSTARKIFECFVAKARMLLTVAMEKALQDHQKAFFSKKKHHTCGLTIEVMKKESTIPLLLQVDIL